VDDAVFVHHDPAMVDGCDHPPYDRPFATRRVDDALFVHRNPTIHPTTKTLHKRRPRCAVLGCLPVAVSRACAEMPADQGCVLRLLPASAGKPLQIKGQRIPGMLHAFFKRTKSSYQEFNFRGETPSHR